MNSAVEMYAALGYGGLQMSRLLPKIKDEYAKLVKSADPVEIFQMPIKKQKSNEGVIVEGIDNCLIKFAKCCNPLPGDEIVGFITRGYGVSIHKKDCPNAVVGRNLDESSPRWVNAYWADGVKESFKSTLEIIAIDRPGLIADISALISGMKVPIYAFSARQNSDGRSSILVTIGINNIDHLGSVIARIRRSGMWSRSTAPERESARERAFCGRCRRADLQLSGKERCAFRWGRRAGRAGFFRLRTGSEYRVCAARSLHRGRTHSHTKGGAAARQGMPRAGMSCRPRHKGRFSAVGLPAAGKSAQQKAREKERREKGGRCHEGSDPAGQEGLGRHQRRRGAGHRTRADDPCRGRSGGHRGGRAAAGPQCAEVRIFEDEQGKMNRSAPELGYEALVVSNFTCRRIPKRAAAPALTGRQSRPSRWSCTSCSSTVSAATASPRSDGGVWGRYADRPAQRRAGHPCDGHRGVEAQLTAAEG